jgi:hypothetical protein
MFAAVTSWQFGDSHREPAAQHAFLRDLVRTGVARVREAGAVDIVLILLAPDRFTSVVCFEDMETLNATRLITQAVLAEHFADALIPLGRETGKLFEPYQSLAQDRQEMISRREQSGGTDVYLARWSVGEQVLAEGVEQWVRSIWSSNTDFLQELGLLDRMVIQVAPDQLLALNFFPAGEDGAGRYHQAITNRPKMLENQATFVAGEVGRAFDIPEILDQ